MARNPFWTWSLRLYKQPGVAPACIALQDRAGIDVNLLLFCLWTGSRHIILGAAKFASARKASAECGPAIGILREARRLLKPAAQASPRVERIRRNVLRLELEAEQLEQDRLYALVQTVTPGRGEGVMIAADNLSRYLRAAGIRLARRDWQQLTTVVRSAFPSSG